MDIQFFKYHGTGNDFVLINALNHEGIHLTQQQIQLICHRRFGIGADGLMFLRSSDKADFYMDYYNSDGNRSTMCGNGGRCISQLYFHLFPTLTSCRFLAVDGLHTAQKLEGYLIALAMSNTDFPIQDENQNFVINTGSPHYLSYVEQIDELSHIVHFGKKIRYNKIYHKEGINVNLIHAMKDSSNISMATYERGVEDETYSCGTGVVAAALTQAHRYQLESPISVSTKGGDLSVTFTKCANRYEDIILIGPAIKVFEGTYLL